MSYAPKKLHTNRTKRWIITIGIFILVQLIFIAIDGTFLEPRLNDSGLFAEIKREVLESRLLTEWVAPYSFPLFNLFLIIFVVAMLIQAVGDMISTMFVKK
ncbi:YfzA family protein [Paenibacillus sp. FSL H7-0940]|uniref:YfzA family protein n=1 Tax=Paenibacillus sp. FSL H7-0940 TaxID=2921443 RepID=UPI0030EF93F3